MSRRQDDTMDVSEIVTDIGPDIIRECPECESDVYLEQLVCPEPGDDGTGKACTSCDWTSR